MPGEKKILKFILVGDSGVGKTQILNRFIQKTFSNQHKITIGADFMFKQISIGENEYSLQCWDTGGGNLGEKGQNMPFQALGNRLLINSHAIAIVLDGTKSSKEQTEAMTRYFEHVKNQGVPIYFIVNKTDSPDFNMGTFQSVLINWQNSTERQNIPVLFCSAKDGKSVDDAFFRMAEGYDAKIRAEEDTEEGEEGNSVYLPTAYIPSKNRSLWQDFKDFCSDNPIWVGVNQFLIPALIIFLIIAAFPVGAIFALGPLSALAVVGIIGGAALLLWNVGYPISKALYDSAGEPPSTRPDNPTRLRNSRTSNAAVVNPNDFSYKAVYEEHNEVKTESAPPAESNTGQPPATNPKLGSREET